MKKTILTLTGILLVSTCYAAGDVPATYPRTYRDYPDKTTPQNAASLNNEVLRSRRFVIAEDKDATSPPVTCSSTYNGYTYLITAAPSGGWASASTNDIAICTYQDSSAEWKFVTPKEGYLARLNDEDNLYAFTGSSWTQTPSVSSSQVQVTDNESTAENNVVTFVADADADGGTVSLESDGDFYYTPSTGTVTATEFSGGGSGLTGIISTTANALASDPSDCSSNQFANAINTTADLSCSA